MFEPSGITVADYLGQWYKLSCMPNLKYNTHLAYQRIIEGHLVPRFGNYRLKALTPAILQEYANSLKLNGYSKSHITGILAVFQSALDYAVEPLHYISQNPMKAVRTPKIERKPRERIILSPSWNCNTDSFEWDCYFFKGNYNADRKCVQTIFFRFIFK